MLDETSRRSRGAVNLGDEWTSRPFRASINKFKRGRHDNAMPDHSITTFEPGRTTLEQARESARSIAVASSEFVFDAPEFKSAANDMNDSAPTLAPFEQALKAAHPRKPRLVWIVVGALCISMALIASAIIATTLYL